MCVSCGGPKSFRAILCRKCSYLEMNKVSRGQVCPGCKGRKSYYAILCRECDRVRRREKREKRAAEYMKPQEVGRFLSGDVYLWWAVTGHDLFSYDVHDLLPALSTQERGILWMRYGLDEKRPKTLEAVATELKLSRERVRQIEKGALRKMRQELMDQQKAPVAIPSAPRDSYNRLNRVLNL